MRILDRIKDRLSRKPAQGETERGTKTEARKAAPAKPAFTVHDLIRRGVPKAPKFEGPKATNRISRCGPKSKRGAPVPAQPKLSKGGWLWVSRVPCPRDPKTGALLTDEWPKGVSAKRLKNPVDPKTGEVPTVVGPDTVLRHYEPLVQGEALRRQVRAAKAEAAAA